MAKYLDYTGLTRVRDKIKAWVRGFVKLSSGTITIGESSITPLVEADIANKADKATTLAGYGITDAKIADGTVTLGSNSIKPLTSHQDISGKADKSEMAVSTSGDKTTITLKTGTAATVLNAHQDISSKADKTTTVNGHALSANVTVTKSDVGLGNVTNEAQIPLTQKGAASGVCPLNASSKIDAQYLPSYVDDVIEAYARTGQTALTSAWLSSESASGAALTPETGKIYVLMADAGDYAANTQFRWGGTAYVKLADGGVSAITNAEIDAIFAE